jgi:ubiquinone/menaquinone biosynthesis C-methylase UbiE
MLARADAGSEARASLAGLLRCPDCDAEVVTEVDEAVCRTGGHRFPIVDGVIVIVDDETLAADPQYHRQREYFDAEFMTYGRYRLAKWRVGYLRRLRASGLLGELESPLVDVGVGGSGYTVIEAARAGQPAVGCDLSLEGLVAARRFAIAEGVAERTLWVCCSAEKLPLASSSFASALAIAVIEHVPDDRSALSEIARVLQPGGRAWITVPHALRHISPIFRPVNRRHDRRLGHLRRYEAETLLEAGRELGLQAEEVQFTGHSIKVVQIVGDTIPAGRFRDRLWWWCEARDLRRSREARGSMQLSVVFTRAA